MTFVKTNYKPARNFTHLFDELLNDFPAFSNGSGQSFPPVNIVETSDAYHLELSAPGRSKEDFKVSLDNEQLTISYEKKEETKNDDVKSIRREFGFQSFKRSFSLDNKIDAAAIQAKYENGLLKLFLPKKAEVKEGAKDITIQ